MDRRRFLRGLGAGAAMLALPGCASARQRRVANKQPNFVFFLIDDLGWTDVGCFGSGFYETPNIDRLASQGMKFTNAYAACPVCSPTRGSILTGKYPARLGITQWIGGPNQPTEYKHFMDLEEVTIAEAMKGAGYATAFVGKWHLGNKPYYPDKQGFDVNIGGDSSGSPPTYFYPYKTANRALEEMPAGGEEGEYLTDRLTSESLKWLDANRDKPFLLYLSHYAVHTPIQSKLALTDKYKAKVGKLPKTDGAKFTPVYGKYRTKMVQDNAAYAGMVQSVDESVGRVMTRLEELGVADNTIVIFMSDNGGLSTVPNEGPTCNLPLRAGKGWLYEGGIREPMIIKWPGVVQAGSECGEPVTSTDFYPTMLEMAGMRLRPEQHVDGVSLVPLLTEKGKLKRKAIYWHYPHYHGSGNRPSGAVRAGDYKLIEWYENGAVELYNLRDDISEKEDLAEKMPQKAAELKAMLAEWLKQVNAKMPASEPRNDFEVFEEARREQQANKR
ncbi:MAG: sulfatase-like hydrolase/transferase [Sedimentisphaerales bacterium]|nr:sulfatase-like hydrolase/transferase [Sedimentisphaerales bacterium]